MVIFQLPVFTFTTLIIVLITTARSIIVKAAIEYSIISMNEIQ